MRQHRLLKTGIGGLVAMVLLVTTASPAAADGWEEARRINDQEFSLFNQGECKFTANVDGCFQPYGEHIWVRDSDRDGDPVAMHWKFRNNRTGRFRQGVVYDRWGEAEGWSEKNKSFAENQDFWFRVCVVSSIGGRRLGSCSGWTDPTPT